MPGIWGNDLMGGEGEENSTKSSTPTARCVNSQRPPTFQDS